MGPALQTLSVTFGDSSPRGRAKSVGPAALSGPGDEDADCCASLRLARNDTARRLLLIAVGKESPERLQTLSVTFSDSSPRGRVKSVGPAAHSGPGDEDMDCRASLRLARNDTARRLLLIAVGKESPERLQTLSVTFSDSSPRGRAKSVGPAALSGPGRAHTSMTGAPAKMVVDNLS